VEISLSARVDGDDCAAIMHAGVQLTWVALPFWSVLFVSVCVFLVVRIGGPCKASNKEMTMVGQLLFASLLVVRIGGPYEASTKEMTMVGQLLCAS